MTDSWILTLPCTKAEAEMLAGDLPDLADLDPAPVLVTSEPDDTKPDAWQLDAYFEGKPARDVLKAIARLVPSARENDPKARPLPSEDWVTMSQEGLEPLIAGRFHVRTPHFPARRDLVDFVIPAGLAFGTGQHATTSGCLSALDQLKREGKVFRNLIDVGTGTGLLAFAAMHLWPIAKAMATDIDPISIDVVRENMALNDVGGLQLVVADGMSHREIVAHAPYDLVIANILAQPLIDMAPWIAAAVAQRGTLILAGLLDVQAAAVIRAYKRQGMRLTRRGAGEWPVLVMRGR
jgi:ribosomal protein L11 methyltransferase